jgi:hypothetical protein
VTVSPDQREIAVKIALTGAADSGKLAILRAIAFRKGVAQVREYPIGALRTFRAEWTEPLEGGKRLRIAVHSLTGQTAYDAAEELLTRDADGLIFVADATPDKFRATWEALMRLGDNARRNGYDLRSVALALQYHHAERHPGFDPHDLDAKLGVPQGSIPRFVSTDQEPDAAGLAFDSVMAQIDEQLLAEI